MILENVNLASTTSVTSSTSSGNLVTAHSQPGLLTSSRQVGL